MDKPEELGPDAYYVNSRGGLQLKDEYIDFSDAPPLRGANVIWRGPIAGFLKLRREQKLKQQASTIQDGHELDRV